MANITLDTRIAHKIDTRERWGTSSLVLLKGELALDEFGTYKVGDGVKTWSQLPFSGGNVVVEKDTDPTTSDTNYDVGQHWLNTTTKEYYILADKATGLWLHMTHTSENDVTKTYVDEQLALKADKATVTESLAKKADLVDGKVPASQLPSYVDDVVEYENYAAFPQSEQEPGKIYVDKETNKTYRWSGSAYVEISASLALGETAQTAFAGDRGKALEDKVTALEAADEALGDLAALDTVDAAHLDASAVTTEKIADSNVTEGKIANSAVTTGKIADSAIAEGKIATSAVTETKIADNAVVEAKIATSAVSTAKIADGAVTDAKIVSLALDKLTNATTNTVVFSCGNSEE